MSRTDEGVSNVFTKSTFFFPAVNEIAGGGVQVCVCY